MVNKVEMKLLREAIKSIKRKFSIGGTKLILSEQGEIIQGHLMLNKNGRMYTYTEQASNIFQLRKRFLQLQINI